MPYIDTDELIEKKTGLTRREINQKFGTSYFRKLEKETILNLHPQNSIIALGGGSVLDPDNVEHLKQIGRLIYLKAPKEMLKKRILTPPYPSFIDPDHPEESFEKMYNTRKPQYEKIDAIKVDLQEKSTPEILEELWQVINLDKSFESPHGVNPMEKP